MLVNVLFDMQKVILNKYYGPSSVISPKKCYNSEKIYVLSLVGFREVTSVLQSHAMKKGVPTFHLFI